MRKNKSYSLKKKRPNKHLRGIKKYTLSNKQSNEQKDFDCVSTSPMLLATNVKYRFFAILASVSGVVSLVLVVLNLFLGFVAYVTVNLVDNSNFFQLVGVKEISFMTVFESFYFGNVKLMIDMFVTICVTIIVFSLSLYIIWATEKKADINSLTNQYYRKVRNDK